MPFELGIDIVQKVEKVGDFTITIQEKTTNSSKVGALVTFHDIGLNHTSFRDFFNNEYNIQFYDKFVVYHIDAPGQEPDAEKFSSEYQFPSLPKLAEMLGPALEHFQLKDAIGLGIGAGANVLALAAMAFPEKFLGLVLVDPASKSPGFLEWGEQKLAAWHLETKGFTTIAEKFLIWHLFGSQGKQKTNLELVDSFIKDITQNRNPHNLAQFVRAYMQRSDVTNEIKEKFKTRVLIITSAYSPYKEEGYLFHSLLDATQSSVLESSESSNVFFEDPSKCGEGMLLLMQGLGLVPNLRTRTASRGGPVIHRSTSMCEEN